MNIADQPRPLLSTSLESPLQQVDELSRSQGQNLQVKPGARQKQSQHITQPSQARKVIHRQRRKILPMLISSAIVSTLGLCGLAWFLVSQMPAQAPAQSYPEYVGQ